MGDSGRPTVSGLGACCAWPLAGESGSVTARLYGIPGSGNTAVAEAMLRHKGIAYARRDLIPGAHRLLLALLGFRGRTVPALRLDGSRVLGTRAIARFLEHQRPMPPLFPDDHALRRRVEDAERFGELVMQPFPRHILWAGLRRNPAAARSFLADARLGFPSRLAWPMIRPIVAFMCRLYGVTDGVVREDLRQLTGALEHVDSLIDDATIGGARNAADFQLAAQVRMLMCLDDLRPIVQRHRCAALAMSLYPAPPGRVPPVLTDYERALL